MRLRWDASHSGQSREEVGLYCGRHNLSFAMATVLLAISSTPAVPPETTAQELAREVVQNEV